MSQSSEDNEYSRTKAQNIKERDEFLKASGMMKKLQELKELEDSKTKNESKPRKTYSPGESSRVLRSSSKGEMKSYDDFLPSSSSNEGSAKVRLSNENICHGGGAILGRGGGIT